MNKYGHLMAPERSRPTVESKVVYIQFLDPSLDGRRDLDLVLATRVRIDS